jgi:hypothetical protein
MSRKLFVAFSVLAVTGAGLIGCGGTSVQPDGVTDLGGPDAPLPDVIHQDMRHQDNPVIDTDEGPDVPVPPPDLPPDMAGTPGTCDNPVDLATAGTALANGVQYSGSTTDAQDNDFGTCVPGLGANEVVHSFTVPSTATAYRVVASTNDASTNFDTVVYLRTTCTERFTQIACDNDSGTSGTSIARARVDAGTQIFIFVDGNIRAQTSDGNYQLTVTATPIVAEGGACDPNGVDNVCDDGLACLDGGTGPTCQLTTAPILYGLQAFRYPNGTLRMVIMGSDAESDVTDATFTALDAQGNVSQYDDGSGPVQDQPFGGFDTPPSGTVFTVGATFVAWFTSQDADTASVVVTLVDAAGHTSDPLSAPVEPIDTRGTGEPCDPAGIDNVCAGKDVCTTMGGQSTCVLPDRANQRCMALGTPVSAATGVEETIMITPNAAEEVFEGSCSKERGFDEKVYAIQVPTGTTGMDLVATSAFADNELDTYMYIRHTCADAQTELACNDDIVPGFGADANYHSLVSVNNVRAGTYYVFVDTSQPNGVDGAACTGNECPDGTCDPTQNNCSCQCVAQATHVKIYLRTVLASGASCDPTQLANRCPAGTTCSGTAGSETCR